MANEIGMFIDERIKGEDEDKNDSVKLKFVAELFVNQKSYDLIKHELDRHPVILRIENRIEDGKGVFSSGKKIDLKDLVKGGMFIS